MVFFAPEQQGQIQPVMAAAEEVLEQITLPVDTVISSKEVDEKHDQLVQIDESEPVQPQKPELIVQQPPEEKQTEMAQLKMQKENSAVIENQPKQTTAVQIEQKPQPVKAEVVVALNKSNKTKTILPQEYALKHKDQHTFKEVISVKQETVGSFKRIEELFKNL